MKTNKAPRPSRVEDAAKAFAFWEQNSFLSKQELCEKFSLQPSDITFYMRENSKGRPDGRVVGKDSPRQVLLKEVIDKAIKGDLSLEWAYTQIKNAGHSLGKGDIRYYTMKHDLPSLREEKPIMTKGGKYG